MKIAFTVVFEHAPPCRCVWSVGLEWIEVGKIVLERRQFQDVMEFRNKIPWHGAVFYPSRKTYLPKPKLVPLPICVTSPARKKGMKGTTSPS